MTGKTQLYVEDAQWTPDDQFVLILLKGGNSAPDGKSMPGTLCILPRLGVSFIRIFNPTRFNLARSVITSVANSVIGSSSMAAKEDFTSIP